MAAMALPLRELSADVQIEAAHAQKAFLGFADGVKRHKFHLWLKYKTYLLDTAMGKLIDAQQTLIVHLESANRERFTPEIFERLANDLDRIVSSSMAFVDDAKDVLSQHTAAWRTKLDTISDLAERLDSFAESFHTAANAECTAVLAGVARNIMAQGEPATRQTPDLDQTAAIAALKPAKEQNDLALEFARLAKTWKTERRAASSSVAIVTDPSYQRIISLGRPVVPFILRELQRETDHWFWALRVITGDDPVAPRDRGKIQKMASSWLEWGRKKGYV